MILVLPKWLGLLPFFLSAALYLSPFVATALSAQSLPPALAVVVAPLLLILTPLAIFAPLPILLLFYRSKAGDTGNPANRRFVWAAIATNTALVFGAAGVPGAALYVAVIGTIAVALPEFLRRPRMSLERAIGFTLLVIIGVSALWIGAASVAYHVNPIHEFRTELAATMDTFSQSIPKSSGGPGEITGAELEEWRNRIEAGLPSSIAIFLLFVVWANLLLLLRLNPAGLRQRLGLAPDYLYRWSAPEWLIWPVIACGVFLIVEVTPVSLIAMSVFRFLMAIYVIQGLSVVGFFFNLWNVRGTPRAFGYVLAVLVMTPLLLSLGFFDLWFDFRGKVRQS